MITSLTESGSTDEVVTFDCDEILEEVGGFGLWQIYNLVLCWLPALSSGFLILAFSFTALKPNQFRCVIPGCDIDSHDEFDAFPNISLIFPSLNSISGSSSIGTPNYCRTYPLIEQNISASSTVGNCTLDDFDLTVSSPNELQVCDPSAMADSLGKHVLYEPFEMDATIVTEFDLVCDEGYKVALAQSMYMVGIAVGSSIFGRICDKFGRRIGNLVAIFISAVSHFGAGFTTTYEGYVVSRFFSAIGSSSYLTAFILSVEVVDAKHRTFAGTAINIPFAIGEALVGVLAIFEKNWRWLHFWSSIPIFTMIAIYLVLSESPRWLLSKNRYLSFENLVRKIAKVNRKSLSSDSEDKFRRVKERPATYRGSSLSFSKRRMKKASIFDLFRHSSMRKNTLIMFVNWIVVTLGYYGITMRATSLGSDKFISSILSCLVEIPSYVSCYLFMDHLGRKPTCSLNLILCGLCCFPAAFLSGAAQTAFSLLGKFGASSAFAIIFLYTAELYPTEVRTTAVGICSMMARIGGIIAPQVALYLPTLTTEEMPMIFMGLCALFGGLLSLLLPETLGSVLVESIDDVEHLGDGGKPFFSWWSSRKLDQHLHHLNNIQIPNKKYKPKPTMEEEIKH